MNLTPTVIRKVAIVISALPSPQEADKILDQFTPDQAQSLRQAVVELGDVDPVEERRVLEEFLRGGFRLDEMTRPQPPRRQARPSSADSAGRAFLFLHDAEADKLAKALAVERPQAIALVLSHLPPEQAGSVLVRLDAALQVDVVRRLIDLEETDPEILREVELALESRLSQQITMQRRRTAGLKALSGILDASAPHVGNRILENLAGSDRGLAERLGPEPIDFEDMILMDDDDWVEVLSEAGEELATLALLGAPPRLVDRVLRRLPGPDAVMLRERLEKPGPVRLRDVEDAQRELAEVARRLGTAGRIALPRHATRKPLVAAA